jgi:hypothetical protein
MLWLKATKPNPTQTVLKHKGKALVMADPGMI